MKTYTPELSPSVLGRLAAYAASGPASTSRGCCSTASARASSRSPAASACPTNWTSRTRTRPCSSSSTTAPGMSAPSCVATAACWPRPSPPHGASSSSTTSPSPSRAATPSACRGSTAAPWARRPTARSPSVSTTSAPRATTLDLRLYLPEGWLSDAERLDKAGVPQAERRSLTKAQIALELLDGVRAEGLPGCVAVADAGYGVSGDFRDGLQARGLSYVVGVTGDFVVFTREPLWEMPAPPGRAGGRPRTRPRLAEGGPQPVALGELAKTARLRRVSWREGTKGKLSGRFAWLRVWPATGWQTGQCAGKGPVWLLIEEQADGKIKYALSNLPEGTGLKKAVAFWKSRWPVEQGYQQMKEELGLDHFEGRSWRGFHHHAALVMLAYGFPLLQRHRGQEHPVKPGKKGAQSQRGHYRPSAAPCSTYCCPWPSPIAPTAAHT